MAIGGFANRIAHIDLSTSNVSIEPVPQEWARQYIGGRGLGVKFVFENGPEVDPLSPDNILCFMNGPLTGTEVNLSGRMAVVTKSPLTGTVTDSHHGGWSAARLRWAGFDGLIFKGKAEKPSYIYIHDDQVEILDASEVWGKGVHDTVKHFQEKYGEKDLSVAVRSHGLAEEAIGLIARVADAPDVRALAVAVAVARAVHALARVRVRGVAAQEGAERCDPQGHDGDDLETCHGRC